MEVKSNKLNHAKVINLLEHVRGKRRALIATHNDPDPDAIASAFGLSHLLRLRSDLPSTICYCGTVGRAENRAMVAELDIELVPLDDLNLAEFDVMALVDAQPGQGNTPAHPSFAPSVVIDHHPLRPATKDVAFHDVRPEYSASSTIVTGYLRDAKVHLNARLATALFYGIKTDTLGLARPAHHDDIHAYMMLQRRADAAKLLRIETARVPPEFFQVLDAALHKTSVNDGIVVADVGEMRYPDMAAEIADFLQRLEGIRLVMAIGHYAGDVIFSLRAPDRTVALDGLAQEIVGSVGSGGGHGSMAAGRVRATLLGSADQTKQGLIDRLYHATGVRPMGGRPLLA